MSTRFRILLPGILYVKHFDVVGVNFDLARSGLAVLAPLSGFRPRLGITLLGRPHLRTSNRPLLATVIAGRVDSVLVAPWQ